ncbi:hypothetical protein SAMN05421827_10577 [Pedobacter terrae]|uniref:Uncharacterized protein n=1 Tax=Pedobacter terrae TaxID=405671 RepID=A0A1G7T6B6_9SPHI|nr:hypothetical protein SAMN05421827_10577 [Pedobacter terrae]
MNLSSIINTPLKVYYRHFIPSVTLNLFQGLSIRKDADHQVATGQLKYHLYW